MMSIKIQQCKQQIIQNIIALKLHTTTNYTEYNSFKTTHNNKNNIS